MTKKKKPTISAKHAAEVFRDVLQTRRIDYDDTSKVNMADLWEGLAETFEETRIKYFKAGSAVSSKRAGVVTFDNLTTLVVSKETMDACRNGDRFCNFFLAHEFMHVELGHFEETAKVRNFKMGEIGGQNAILPADEIEYDADFAGVAFLCGVLLLAPNPNASVIAQKAGCPIDRVKAALRITQLDAFKQAFAALSHSIRKIVL
ncbi:MAG: hypothetical protein AAFY38_09220 [Pseudomonadota bacterium]